MLQGTPTGIYKLPSGPKSIYLKPCHVSEGRSFIKIVLTGKDLEFNRGYSSFNHKLGDKTNINNPNLGPIIKPPFYSLKIEAATLGTATGLKTDENCRVFNSKGSPIEGLFAVGNDMTSMMRGFYPGGGITIGPAIAFSYQMAEYIKETKNNG